MFHFVTINLSYLLEGGTIMKIEPIIIPKGVKTLDFIASLGEVTAKAWIFLDFNATVDLFINSKPRQDKKNRKNYLYWNKRVANFVCLRAYFDKNQAGIAEWNEVLEISRSDISFTIKPDNPSHIFFIRKESVTEI